MIEFSAQTHIGQRKVNEDSYFVDEDLGLYIVADGVGGLAKGEVASQMTCETIHNAIKNGIELIDAVENAHKKLLADMAVDENLKGMASTVVVALFKGNKYQLAWVGDSRAYLWDGGLKLITKDHSYVELLYENGHITFEQMETHPNKNVISQALGSSGKDISVAFNQGTLEKGQILLLATDGLYGIAKEKTIIDGINQIKSLEELTKALVQHAVQNQGKDNITLLTIQSDVNSNSQSDVLVAEVVRTFNSESGDVEELKLQKHNNKEFQKSEVKSIPPKSIKSDQFIQKHKPNKWLLGILLVLGILFTVLLLLKTFQN